MRMGAPPPPIKTIDEEATDEDALKAADPAQVRIPARVAQSPCQESLPWLFVAEFGAEPVHRVMA